MIMGQHKFNPNCQLAREGKLPPKPKKMFKREQDRWLYSMIREKTGIGRIERMLGVNSYEEAKQLEDLMRK
jgi:hypothetical protein